MIAVVVLAVLLLAWLVVSAITVVACTAVVRGGVQEDRARGFLDDRS